MYSRCIKTLMVMAAALFFSFCDRSRTIQKSEIPEFHPLISAFTSGLVSSGSNIAVRFSKSFSDSIVPNTIIDKKVIEFSPSLEGDLYYVDGQTVEFRPDKRLPQGITFNAVVRPDRLFPNSYGKSAFKFDFHVIAQHLEIHLEGFRPYSDYNPIINYLTGRVVTADEAEPEAIEEMLYVIQQGKRCQVSWDHSADGREHGFIVDSIKRGDQDSEIAIHYDGSMIGSGQKGVETYTVPSLGSFEVISHRVVQYPEQHVVISFSDPILRQQMLKGLIRLESDADLRFSVEGNNVLAYPSVRQNGTITLFVEEGVRNVAGKILEKGERLSVVFEEIHPAIELLGRGVIVPVSGSARLPFKAVNLKAIDVRVIKIFENNIGQFLQVNEVSGNREIKRAGRLIMIKEIDLASDSPINYGEWNSFSLDLSDLIESEPGAIYRIELGFRQEHSLFPCGEDALSGFSDHEAGMSPIKLEEGELGYWDSDEIYYSYDYYNYEGYTWEDREDPCKPAYYGRRRSVSRNILASNLGIIAKKGSNNELLVTVTDLLRAEPLQNVRIRVHNFQQQIMDEGTTDPGGNVTFRLSGEPFLVIASLGDEKGYLKLNDGSSLSYSMFDVSGTVVRKGLKAFIYGERGVWRPGDSLFINMILDDTDNPLPPGHPVLFELKDPRGKVVSRKVQQLNGTGFYSFHTSTASDAITGRYLVTARVGGTAFTKSLRIETIKPNRLKIELSFREDTLFPARGKIAGKIFSKWLTGAAAANLRTETEVILKSAGTVFDQYERYVFEDPSRELISKSFNVFSGLLDGSGYATFTKELEISGEAPGMLKAIFTTRVFERTGNFSIDRMSVPCSPYNTYVGIKIPPGDERGVLLTDSTHHISVVTLDASGRAVNRVGLHVRIYKLDWRWWWESSSENLSSYMGSSYLQPVYDTTISTRNGKGSFHFRVGYPDWGRYLVQVDIGSLGHSAGKIVYVDWPGWAGRANREDPDAASILTFSSDKKTYTIGEDVVVTIPTSLTGRLLVSIENGSGILQREWIQTAGPETRYRFKATPEMSPNVYLYATLIQPYGQTENDLPIRLFGVVPIGVVDPKTILKPELKIPDELSPNSKARITVSEAGGREMTYTLALVDEGLLDLTRHKTPDPWTSFYEREALGVKTWDMFEHVLGAYGGRIDGIYQIGGGEEEEDIGTREANRFPPMVRFMGPFTLKGKSHTHTVEVPNYIGSVRTMLVAGHEGSYGHTEKTIPVRKPLMVLSTLPRVLGPGETVALPVDVFVMEERIKRVNLQIETNEFIAVNEPSGTLNFEGTGDRIAEFSIKTAERTGIAKVRVKAVSGSERASHEIELNVRSPNPPVTLYRTAVLDSGEQFEEKMHYVGMPGTNEFELELSKIPPVDFGRRLKFLTGYPHGCIEQITSAAFPQLFLAEVVEMNATMKEKMETHVKDAIKRLSTFQMSDGSFSYWPDRQDMTDWGTSYAGHFMTEAKAKGYEVPTRLFNDWMKHQRRSARRWSPSGRYNLFEIKQEQLLQSYRLFTLALAGEAELGAMNRMRERSDLTHESRWRLAAAYSLAGQNQTARDLVENASIQVKPYQDSKYSYGSELRDQAMILEAMILMDMRDEAIPVMEKVAAGLSSERWWSTQTIAYGLIGIAKFTGGIKQKGNLRFEYVYNDSRPVKAETGMPVARIAFEPGMSIKGNIMVINRGDQLIYLRMINRGVPAAGGEKPVEQNLSMTVDYMDLEGNRIEMDHLIQGTDFKAVYTVKNPGTLGYYDNMALTTIFPSGWEVHNERMFGAAVESSEFDYQDIRDDRIMTYFSLGPNRSINLAVRLNAAYRGRFYLPSAVAEEMYRNDVQVLIPGKWVNVIGGE